MQHLVKYRTADGRPAEHEVADLASAIAHVERLRNEEGVSQARIFTIEEVAFEFKPYFKVELGGTSTRTAAPRPSKAAAPKVAAAAPKVAKPAEADAPIAPVWSPPAEESAEAGDTATPWTEAPAPTAATRQKLEESVPASNGAGRRGLFGR